MTIYATSKVVHAALKRALSPWFTANGWKRRPGYSLNLWVDFLLPRFPHLLRRSEGQDFTAQ